MSKNVRIKRLIEGTGVPAKKGDTLVIDLEAHLPGGDIAFAYERFAVELGKRRVFPGLEEGLQEMKVGETREVNVPPHLAYGQRGAPNVPPNAALKLVLRLLEITKR